jgi:hypothetical protein
MKTDFPKHRIDTPKSETVAYLVSIRVVVNATRWPGVTLPSFFSNQCQSGVRIEATRS